MHKKAIRTVAVIVILIMILSTASFAVAPRASRYIISKSASVIPTGSGNLTIEFSVTGSGTMTKIGASVVEVYKEDGTLIKTYSYTNPSYANMMGYNTFQYSSNVTYSGVSGQRYYAIVTFFAKNSNGSDSKTYTTSTVTA